jgi:hypothetical protein
VEFAPVFIGESGGATIPTPRGLITSIWRREGVVVDVELTLPRDITAAVRLPGLPPLTMTGRHRWKVKPVSAA